MIKSGLVVKTENNTAVILAPSGKFYKILTGKSTPKIGEEFSGKIKNSKSFYSSYIAAAALFFIILTSGGGAYAYYSPTTTVVVNINPSIELKSNRFDKIISCRALNEDGEKILEDINIKNKSLNDGLNIIVAQSQKDNFINETYVTSGKMIDVNVVSKDNKKLNLSNFESTMSHSGLNVKIDNVGVKTEIKNNKTETITTPKRNEKKNNNNTITNDIDIHKTENDKSNKSNTEPSTTADPNKNDTKPKHENKNTPNAPDTKPIDNSTNKLDKDKDIENKNKKIKSSDKNTNDKKPSEHSTESKDTGKDKDKDK